MDGRSGTDDETVANSRPAKFKEAPLPYAVPVGDPFQELFGTGGTVQRQLIQNGEVESVLVGAGKSARGRRMIIVSSYLAYLERQKQREAAGEIGWQSPNPRARKREPVAVSPTRIIQRPQSTAQPRQKYQSRRRSG
jgi:hypothetical protein